MRRACWSLWLLSQILESSCGLGTRQSASPSKSLVVSAATWASLSAPSTTKTQALSSLLETTLTDSTEYSQRTTSWSQLIPPSLRKSLTSLTTISVTPGLQMANFSFVPTKVKSCFSTPTVSTGPCSLNLQWITSTSNAFKPTPRVSWLQETMEPLWSMRSLKTLRTLTWRLHNYHKARRRIKSQSTMSWCPALCPPESEAWLFQVLMTALSSPLTTTR